MKHMTLQDVIDRQEIYDTLMRYTHSMDRLDDDMLRSVFWPDAVVAFPSDVYQGDVMGFLDNFLLRQLHVEFSRTQHFVGNFRCEIEGDVAYVEAYLMANHRGTAEHYKWANKHVILWGRYIQRYERRDGEWKIAEHRLLIDFEKELEGGWHDLPEHQMGKRDGTDPSETHEPWVG